MHSYRGTTPTDTTSFSFHNTRSFGSFSDHEPGLWRAVITQALMDAASQSPKPDIQRARREALQWLLGHSGDFETVCDHAGMDPSYVRMKAQQALARGCEWRLPAGQGWRTQARIQAPVASAYLN